MTDPQSYHNRVDRLTAARRADTAKKRDAVTKALKDIQREGRPVTRRAIIARAGVHRNFLYRHKDLAARIDEAAADYFPRPPHRRVDRISHDSLLTELATARHRNHELITKVQALERRLSAQGPTPGPALMEQHPVVVELHEHIAELQIAADDKARTIATLREDIEILRETNRSLVREYGLLKP